MSFDNELVHHDKEGDFVKIKTSNTTGNTYISVNGGDEVRIRPEQMERFREFFAEPVETEAVGVEMTGLFFLLRQKKDDPSKVKVCWAESTTSKLYTSRVKAEWAAARQNSQYPKWNYFVVEKEAV